MPDVILFANESGRREADFVISGPYSLWRDMVEGKVDALQSIIDKKMDFSGDLARVMDRMGMLDLLMETAQSVPARF